MAVHSVKFSGPVTWPVGAGNDVAGVSFTTSGSGGTATVNSATGQGTDTLAYDVTWSVSDPAYGDVITFSYTPGVYYEVGGDPVDDAMGDATLVLTNCANVPAPGANNLLLESGDDVLLEDNASLIILE